MSLLLPLTRATLLGAVLAGSCAAAGVESSSAHLREVVRKSAAGLSQEGEHRSQYLFKARSEHKEFDSSGQMVDRRTHVWERVEIEGFTFARTIERDGKPLTAEERKAEEAAIRKQLAELKAPAPAVAGIGGVLPAPIPHRTQQQQPRQDEWFREFPEALDFKLMGEEVVGSRPTLRLEATPVPGYQAKNMRARVFEKMKATLWIDKATCELVRADAEMFDTVSVGFGVLGKIEKGTRFHIQRRMLPDGIWLIDSQSARFGARILLFKTMHKESATEWSDFRRRPELPGKP